MSEVYEWFDYDLYNSYKEIATNTLNSMPWCYDGTFFDWATHQLPLLKELADEEEYEGCKAVKDSFIEYVNKHITNESEKISLTVRINEELLNEEKK